MKALYSTLLVALIAAPPSFADCSYPQPPQKVPDGTTATREEMIAAQKEFRAYNDLVKAYTDCLRLEHDAALTKGASTLTEDQKKEMVRIQNQKNDAAVEQAEIVTGQFNEQVRAYKNRDKKK